MVNKLNVFLRQHWHWVTFFLLLLSTISFLVLQKGVWLYVDLSWWPKNDSELKILIQQLLFSWDNSSSTAFGFDRFFVGAQKNFAIFIVVVLVAAFGSALGQILFISLLLLVAFVGSIYLFKLTEANNPKIAALFFCFNPVSIYFISQGTVLVAYAFIPFLLYSTLSIVLKPSLRLIPLNLISIFAVLAYLRIFGVVLILIALISVCFYKQLASLFYKNYCTYIKYFFLYVFTFLIIFVGQIFITIDNINSQANYIEHQAEKYSGVFYKESRNTNLIESLTLGQTNDNFANNFLLINSISSFLLFSVLIGNLLIRKANAKRYELLFLLLFTTIYGLIISAQFLNENIFLIIFTKIFPFLSFNIQWLIVAIVIILSFGIAISSKNNFVLRSTVLLVIIISILPTILWQENYKLHKIDLSNSSNFYTNNDDTKPALFFPHTSIHTQRSIKISFPILWIQNLMGNTIRSFPTMRDW